MSNRSNTDGKADIEGGDDLSRAASLTGIVVVVTAVPFALMVGVYLVLTAAGIESARSLSLAGLITVGAAAAWGLLVAITRLDAKLFGRRPLEE